ncbi:MAG: nucleotide sugar dehydrogenase [Acidobacteriota bacterium]
MSRDPRPTAPLPDEPAPGVREPMADDPAVASHAQRLRARCEDGTVRVGVIGLGYVGLPLALAFAEAGVTVHGFDVDAAKIARLRAGEGYIQHLDAGRVARAVADGRFVPEDDFAQLATPDALLICVPTPLDPAHEPDLRYVDATAAQIARNLRPGQLVVLESTTYPGTTDERLRPVFEHTGLRCGIDFFLAYAPEREDPGNARFGLGDIPKVVGGVDAPSGDLAEALYRRIVPRVVRVGTARAAEATKLTENIFRAVNIALVNELKVLYDALDIDVWEVLDAAATKPFGFMRFTPGPGWGGHCIPIDPYYLSWRAAQVGGEARFVELAGTINREMPGYVIARLTAALEARGVALDGASILLLGLAYKPDIDDPRESPAFALLDALLAGGARVAYHDPHIPEAPAMRTWPRLPAMTSRALDADALAQHDAVLLVTDHRAVDYDFVRRHARLIVDTRGVYRPPAPGAPAEDPALAPVVRA